MTARQEDGESEEIVNIFELPVPGSVAGSRMALNLVWLQCEIN